MTEATTEAVTQEASQATSEAPQVTQDQTNNETPTESTFNLPDEYKDKGWASKIKSQDDVYKQLDNLDSMIGKRPAGIPSKDASDAEWEKFYQAAGRPDEPTYEFKAPEGLPEDSDLSDFNSKASELFHKAGLNPMQAQKLYDAYLGLEMQAGEKQTEASAAKQKELDAEFDGIVKEQFGDNYDAELQKTVETFDKYTPQSLKGVLNDIVVDNPKALAGLVSAINGMQAEVEAIKKSYGVDSGKLAQGAQATPTSTEDIRSELARLRVSPEGKDFTNPKYNETQARINELSATLQRQLKS